MFRVMKTCLGREESYNVVNYEIKRMICLEVEKHIYYVIIIIYEI